MTWDTKQKIREHIWTKMTEEATACFPLPCFGRIPNFVGVEDASKQILRLPEFRKARLIFSAPDYVLHHIRQMALEHQKQLLVATPHLQEFLLLKNIPPRLISKAVTIKAMYKFGEQVRPMDIKRPLDIFCQGSVAIDRKGNRLGKGKGYGDREFLMLKQEGIIDKLTIILTLVHEDQLLEDFTHLMRAEDVPVQIVLTPNGIIRIPS